MQELHAALQVELPDDPRQAADILATISALWAEMLKKLDLEVEATLTINETRRQVRRERQPKVKIVPAA